jgi:hypothetical protein
VSARRNTRRDRRGSRLRDADLADQVLKAFLVRGAGTGRLGVVDDLLEGGLADI